MEWSTRIAFLACALIAVFAAAASATSPGPGGMVGKEAPFFSASDIEGSPVVLERVLKSSSLVVLNFWGVRCGSCLEEMPYLAELSKKFESRKVRVLGVDVDGLDGGKLKEMLPKVGITPVYTLICDPDFKVVDSYNVTVTPLTLLISAGGKVTFQHEGFTPGDEKALEDEILKRLSAPDSR